MKALMHRTGTSSAGRPRFVVKLLRNTGLLVGSGVAGQIAFAVLFILMARLTSAHDVGLASASYGVALILSDIIDFGTSPRALRDLASGTLSGTKLQTFLEVRNLMGLAGVGCWIVAGEATALTFVMSLLFAAYCLIRINQVTFLSMLQASESFGLVSRITVIERLICLAVGALLLVMGAAAALALSAGLCAGASAALVLAMRRAEFRRTRWVSRPQISSITSYFAFGRVFAASGLVTDFLMLDAVIVASLAGADQAGFFAIGARLTGPFGVVATSLGIALTPRVAATPDRRSLRRGLLAVGISSSVITAALLGVVFVGASQFIQLLFGDDYAPASVVVRAYALAGMVVALNQPLCSFLQASGRALQSAVILGIGVAVNLSMVAVGALHDGARGASKGYLLANVIQLILFLVVLRWPAAPGPAAAVSLDMVDREGLVRHGGLDR